jgi:glycosyltransferase involved in cell wall biosynthesis
MMKVPFVSILIPTYNSAKVLAPCLTSILVQSFTEFEIVIVDGGSTDDTVSVCNSLNDKRIRVFSEKDRGIYDAMNKGVQKALGLWLYFLGSDDRFYNDRVLDEMFNEVNLEKFDIVYGNVYSTKFNGIYDGVFNHEKILNQNICHQAIFFKKSVFDTVGSFNLKYNAQADWDHNLRWWFNDKIKVKYIPLVIAEYADGGFSSLKGDKLFQNYKRYNYLLYSNKSLPFKSKILLLLKEYKNSLWKRDVKKFTRFIIKTPQIIFGY